MSLEGTIEPELVRIPAGEFLIGSGQRYQEVIDLIAAQNLRMQAASCLSAVPNLSQITGGAD